MTSVQHTSVLLEATLAALRPRPGERFVDATLGLGGHAAAILAATAPDGRLLGIEADPDTLALARERLAEYQDRATLVQGNFRHLAATAAAEHLADVDGILFDLGVSSLQLGSGGRGFSFQHAAALDMRMDPESERSAADIVNQSSEPQLADILWRYGEEPQSRQIARAIVRRRPVTLTTELAEIVASVVRRPSKIHPATRTFQALRIAVNDEIESLCEGLNSAVAILHSGGRLAVIAFHSLEDRVVKQFFARESRDCVCPPGLPVCVCSHRATLRLPRRSAQKPDSVEIRANPRSRSARLRVAERV